MHIRPGTAGSCEIIIQCRIVSAAENDENWLFDTMHWGDARADYGLGRSERVVAICDYEEPYYETVSLLVVKSEL